MIFGNFSDFTLSNIVIRILVSALLGGIIGLDRGIKRRGAGTKTNTIVCLGATLVMLTEQYVQVNFPGMGDMDRMAAQVISGVGFLGVGTIMVANHQVRGLTTAATLWACACVGLAVGIGFLDGAVLITLLMLIALHLLPFVERFATRKSRYFTVYFDVENNQTVHQIINFLKEKEIQIDSMDILKPKVKGQFVSVMMVLVTPSHMENNQLYELLKSLDEVTSIDVL